MPMNMNNFVLTNLFFGPFFIFLISYQNSMDQAKISLRDMEKCIRFTRIFSYENLLKGKLRRKFVYLFINFYVKWYPATATAGAAPPPDLGAAERVLL